MNTDKIYAEQLANEYALKDTSKVVALRKLDKKAKLPATVFTYTFGIIAADTYCSPYYYIQMDDAREYMHNLAGFGHHQVLIFGDYTKLIKKIAKVMNFNVLEG